MGAKATSFAWTYQLVIPAEAVPSTRKNQLVIPAKAVPSTRKNQFVIPAKAGTQCLFLFSPVRPKRRWVDRHPSLKSNSAFAGMTS